MNVAEAKKLLGLDEATDTETVESAFEEKLFSFKKDILPLLPVPSLVKKRQTQLEAWIAIENTSADSSTAQHSYEEIENAQSAIAFLELYEKEASKLKLDMMNAVSFQALKQSLVIAVELQSAYMKTFKKLFTDYSEALPEEAKSREMIDTGKLLNALKNDTITSDITWEIEKELARINKLSKTL